MRCRSRTLLPSLVAPEYNPSQAVRKAGPRCHQVVLPECADLPPSPSMILHELRELLILGSQQTPRSDNTARCVMCSSVHPMKPTNPNCCSAGKTLLLVQVKSLEDALVAELCPSEGGGQVTSRTGLLLRRLDACTLAEEECTSANPLQVRPFHAISTPLWVVFLPLICLWTPLQASHKVSQKIMLSVCSYLHRGQSGAKAALSSTIPVKKCSAK